MKTLLAVGCLLVGACAPSDRAGSGDHSRSGQISPGERDAAVAMPVPAEVADALALVVPDVAGASDASARAGEWPLAGVKVQDRRAPGPGPCASKSLEQVLEIIWAAHPELRNTPPISTPAHEGFVAVTGFADDDGFNIIFDRGTGDCPSGCIDHELWYFSTDGSCSPVEVGHARSGRCFDTRQVPAWGIPPQLDPSRLCGADNNPQSMSGTYRLRGTGVRQTCPPPAQTDVSLTLTMVVAQDPADPGKGTVTVRGADDPLVDSRPLPATFTRRRFAAEEIASNLPARCADQRSVVVEYDFDGPFVPGRGGRVPGRLTVTWNRSLGCDTTPPGAIPASCQGGLSLDLAPER